MHRRTIGVRLAAGMLALGVLAVACGTAEPAAAGAVPDTADTAVQRTDTAAGVDVAAADTAPRTDAASAIDTAAPQGPTWWKDVRPLILQHCASCHDGKGLSDVKLVDYAEAKPRASLLVSRTQKGTMPPWGAWDTPQCKPRLPFQHDLRLSAADKQVLADWAKAGAPEGNPQDAKAATPLALDLQGVDVTAKPKAPFKASGSKDQFMCFVLDAEFQEAKHLNGVQVVAGNPTVVHHVLVFVDAKGESVKKADTSGQYPCFGGVGVSQQQLVGAWAPGAVPLEFPPNVGTLIQPGSKLVMQVHYHPQGGDHAPDLTSVQLRFLKSKPAWLGYTVLVGNFGGGKNGEGLLPGPNDPPSGPAFVIPKGAKDHTETMRFTLPQTANGKPLGNLHVYGVGTHMHYVGRSMRIEVERPAASGGAACTKQQLDPLTACTQAKCPGLSGVVLAQCAGKQCKQEVGALQGPCGDCLVAELQKGTPDAEVQPKCLAAGSQPKPAGPDQPPQECLLETPEWDFDWQRIYNYDAPLEKLPVLRSGDKVTMTCRYDNSLANPFVAEALEQQGLKEPVDVKLGESTLDEMCLAVLQVVFEAKD